MDMAEALERVEQAGYREHFDILADKLTSQTTEFEIDRVTLIDTVPVDGGTDPADDATIYLLETDTGIRGHLVVPDAFHVGAARARFIDRLLEERRPKSEDRRGEP
jgi:hypothetical protein